MPSKRTYQAPDVEYQFDSHRIGFGDQRHVAVNVKCHAYPKLTEAQVSMLDVLRKEHPQIEDTLRAQAWDDVSEAWWDGARQLADQAGLGDVHSQGRQGGWLVFKDWTLSRVEELIDEREVRCVHCDQLEEEHACSDELQNCLFGSTTFLPTPKLGRDAREKLDALSVLCTEIENSVELVEDSLKACLEDLIKNRYDDHQPKERTDAQTIP